MIRSTSFVLCLLAGSLASAQDRPDEPYLKNVKQLTFGDERAGEAYYSPDGAEILFQAKRGGQPYYQIYRMDADGSGRRMVSTGKGKTTCAYFHPTKRNLFIYASSHLDTRTHKAPKKPRTKRKYKWDYDDSFDIFLADLRTGKIVKQLTTAKGYDAECSFAPDGKTICFTARRKDQPDSIYLMDDDGGNQRPLVQRKGTDCGGPFFSRDGKWVIYRASKKGERTMQVYMTSLDGKQTRQLTHARRINWAPFMHPNGKFAAYAATAKGSYTDFDLFLVRTDGTTSEVALTNHTAFDGLPAFSPDGKHILWSSSRGGSPQVYRAELLMPPAKAFKPQARGHGGAHGGGGGG
ncbi:MAG: PD40 domain-containing protein, partial [Planctomycetes bacterium]|nr:PD40 domain-containing protein [Planctomycetota bacterium]